MLWECDKKHQWSARLCDIKNKNTWCRKCAHFGEKNNNWLKNGLDIAKQIAKFHNGRCLSNEYINNKISMLWECSNGHIWKTLLGCIKDQKTWCPYCAGKFITIKDCKKIANDRNGKCISAKYIDVKTKMLWECSESHKWWATLNDIKSGNKWCPECASYKTQKELTNIVRKLFPKCEVYSNYTNFNWLITDKNRKQELDIYVPKLKLAIEYDGKQHFKPIDFFGGVKAFKNTQRLDKLKNKKIKQHKEDIKYFIRFNYKEDINKQYIVKKLNSLGINI